MKLSVCITTMNATSALDRCLDAIWNSKIKPYCVVISDDSQDHEIQQQNYRISQRYPKTSYTVGPHAGVSANCNSAVNALSDTDLIAFIDDDICVCPDFIANALNQYAQMSLDEQFRTFITGGSPTKLSFQGYFKQFGAPQAVDIHSAVFPMSFFKREAWEEEIFFGYEDAELCLWALSLGYQILHCPELKSLDTRPDKSTLAVGGIGELTEYDIYVQVERLYVGIRRYKNLCPNPVKLATFLTIYFIQMTLHLFRKNALYAWPQIIKHPHIRRLLLRA